jgi:hypothetical protein
MNSEKKPMLAGSVTNGQVEGKVVAVSSFNGRATIPIHPGGKVFVSHPNYCVKHFEEEKEQEKFFSFIPLLGDLATCMCLAASSVGSGYATEHTAVVCLEKNNTHAIWNPDASDPGLSLFSIGET